MMKNNIANNQHKTFRIWKGPSCLSRSLSLFFFSCSVQAMSAEENKPHHHAHHHAQQHHKHHGRICCGHVHVYTLLLSILLVVGIACAWVGATQFSESTFTSTFNAPFFNVWFSTTWLICSFVTLAFPAPASDADDSKPGAEAQEQQQPQVPQSPFFWIRQAISAFLANESTLPAGLVRVWLGKTPRPRPSATRLEAVEQEAAAEQSGAAEHQEHQQQQGEFMGEREPLLHIQREQQREQRQQRPQHAQPLHIVRTAANVGTPHFDNHARENDTSVSISCCLRFALPFTLLWVAANYLYVKALGLITATDVTAVFSATPAVVYVLSLLLLKERVSLLRSLSVALAIGGVVLIALAQRVEGINVGGVVLTLGASLAAASYKVFFKVTLGDARLHTVASLLVLLSSLNIALLWPIWLALKLTSQEPFAWGTVPWADLCGSAALGLLFNFLVNVGVAYTTPLFVSLGTVVGIPLNAAADAVFRGVAISPMQIAGCCLVTLSFILMLVPLRPQS